MIFALGIDPVMGHADPALNGITEARFNAYTQAATVSYSAHETPEIGFAVAADGWASLAHRFDSARDFTTYSAVRITLSVKQPSTALLRVTLNDLVPGAGITSPDEMHWLDINGALVQPRMVSHTVPLSDLRLSEGVGARHNDGVWSPGSVAGFEINIVGQGSETSGTLVLHELSFVPDG
ncbi:hypothetical protein [uncultured Tateyamaria sp.]|uniref:hypothetical protein n=1 Tax=uncultured Tateyamaria sp. TaxID=455651 RepID=UPI00260564F3|nr:hypothetical protein [uncultured Tateyamaria sp.]